MKKQSCFKKFLVDILRSLRDNIMIKKSFRDFLNGTLMQELKCLYEEGKDDCPPNPLKYRYHLFILIAIGIETLGAALDDDWWHSDKEKLSSTRFRKALKTYRSLKKYRKSELYERLRCGMAHVYVPTDALGINMRIEGGQHNIKENDKLLLHIEDLWEDYYAACQELLDNIDGNLDSLNGKLGKKVFGSFINVPK